VARIVDDSLRFFRTSSRINSSCWSRITLGSCCSFWLRLREVLYICAQRRPCASGMTSSIGWLLFDCSFKAQHLVHTPMWVFSGLVSGKLHMTITYIVYGSQHKLTCVLADHDIVYAFHAYASVVQVRCCAALAAQDVCSCLLHESSVLGASILAVGECRTRSPSAALGHGGQCCCAVAVVYVAHEGSSTSSCRRGLLNKLLSQGAPQQALVTGGSSTSSCHWSQTVDLMDSLSEGDTRASDAFGDHTGMPCLHCLQEGQQPSRRVVLTPVLSNSMRSRCIHFQLYMSLAATSSSVVQCCTQLASAACCWPVQAQLLSAVLARGSCALAAREAYNKK
jgi:hypothetical protein